MKFAKTGFWTDPNGTRAMWARWNGTERSSELWELRVKIDEQHPANSVYEWVDATDEIVRFGCGFAGYLGALVFQGWMCTPQPTKSANIPHVLPHIPYPSAMLAGRTSASEIADPGWTLDDTHKPKRWTCRVTDVNRDDERDVLGMKLSGYEVWEFFGTPGDYVRAMLDETDGLDASMDVRKLSPFSWESTPAPTPEPEQQEPEPTASAVAMEPEPAAEPAEPVASASAAPEPAKAKAKKPARAAKPKAAAKPKKAKQQAKPKQAAPVVEPEPVTQEIREVPPTPNANAVTYATVPDLMKAKDCPELKGMGWARPFRTSAGRKVAYVAASNGRCVIAYRSRYQRGSDPQMEQQIAAHVRTLGFTLTA